MRLDGRGETDSCKSGTPSALHNKGQRIELPLPYVWIPVVAEDHACSIVASVLGSGSGSLRTFMRLAKARALDAKPTR